MAHEFCWIEMTTDNPGTARTFYGDLFGWTYDELPTEGGCTYAMFQPEAGGPGGGIMAKPQPQIPTAWMPYVSVDDLEASVARAKELGGSVCMGPTPIKDHGSFAVISDPTGGVIGMWHTEPKAE